MTDRRVLRSLMINLIKQKNELYRIKNDSKTVSRSAINNSISTKNKELRVSKLFDALILTIDEKLLAIRVILNNLD